MPFDPNDPNAIQNMIAPFQKMAQQAYSPYATMSPNSWLAQEHPHIASIMDSALLGAAETKPGATWGENISNIAQGAMASQQWHRNQILQANLLPYQMIQPQLNAQKDLSEIQKNQQQGAFYKANADYTAGAKSDQAAGRAALEASQTGLNDMVTVKDMDGNLLQIPRKNLAGYQGNLNTNSTHLDTNAASNTSREGIAKNNLDEKAAEYKQTDAFKRWKEMQDVNTRMGIARMTAGKAPAAMFQTAEFAAGGLNQLESARQGLKALRDHGVLGGWPTNKIEDQLFGNGTVDPALSPEDRKIVGQTRAALSLASSALLKAHTGRSSQEIYHDLQKMLGVGQDQNALDGAIDEAHNVLFQYANAASDANIQQMRQGYGNAPAPTAPQAAAPQAGPAKVATQADIQDYATHAGITPQAAMQAFQSKGYTIK